LVVLVERSLSSSSSQHFLLASWVFYPDHMGKLQDE
jgi:hypothetical protein